MEVPSKDRMGQKRDSQEGKLLTHQRWQQLSIMDDTGIMPGDACKR